MTLLLNFLGHPILECEEHAWATCVPPNVSFPNICLSSQIPLLPHLANSVIKHSRIPWSILEPMGVEKPVLSIDIHPSSPMYSLKNEGEAQSSPTSLGRNCEVGISPLNSGVVSTFSFCQLSSDPSIQLLGPNLPLSCH